MKTLFALVLAAAALVMAPAADARDRDCDYDRGYGRGYDRGYDRGYGRVYYGERRGGYGAPRYCAPRPACPPPVYYAPRYCAPRPVCPPSYYGHARPTFRLSFGYVGRPSCRW